MITCKLCGGRLELLGDILNPQGLRCTECGRKPDPIVARDGPAPVKEPLFQPPDSVRQLFEKMAKKGPGLQLIGSPGEEGGYCPACYAHPLELKPSDLDSGCSCHIRPPCNYCMSKVPECTACGWRAEEP